MQKLFLLFMILAFFIAVSLTATYGTTLLFPEYSNLIEGGMFILSAFCSIYLFIFDTEDE